MMAKIAVVALVLAVTLPFGFAAATPLRALRRTAIRLAPWVFAPAVLLAMGSPIELDVDARWLLLGLRLGGIDPVTRAYLLFTSVLWFLAAWFARTYIGDAPRRDSFGFFFLTTGGGNIGLIVAQDVASFYVFYAVMTFAAYGLVLHERTDAARRAGRVYLVMAIVAETMLLVALLLVVRERVNIPLSDVPVAIARSPHRSLALALVLVGFGVKAGAVPLHFWLPLAHPVAPAPASAVLSGAIVEAGVLGWLRFLPLGGAMLPDHGFLCVTVGFFSAFYGAAVGSTQTDPKTVLAYSSVSQMGFVGAALGVALMDPMAADAAKAAIVFFAAHHAFAKGALFLGVGVPGASSGTWRRRLVTGGLVVAALAIAGAPLTSGALAKMGLKSLMMQASSGASLLGPLLAAGAVGSTLLMLRFLGLALPSASTASPGLGLWLPWSLLLGMGAASTVLPMFQTQPLGRLVHPSALAAAAWPIAAGCAIAWVAVRLTARGVLARPTIPAGDVVVLVEKAARSASTATRGAARAARRLHRWTLSVRRRMVSRIVSGVAVDRVETRLGRFEVIGLLMLMLVVIVMMSPALGHR